MIKQKLVFILLALISFAMLLTGCGREEEEGGYSIYYLNKDKTRIVGNSYVPEAAKTEEIIKELTERLESESGDVEYKKPIPNEVEITSFSLDEGVLSLYFNQEYSKMDTVEEVLCRAAIVRTLMQVPTVECLNFYVGDAPLTDAEGTLVGVMTDESFIENPGEQINSIQTANITLYFANKKGDGLVREVHEVHYSSNISMEKLVIEHLIEGPESDQSQNAIPPETKIVSVSVLDGVCYLSLDEGFLSQNYEIKEPIVIYSIVNSLSEISNINKVQISVNGDTSGVYRDSYRLDTMYERNLDYITEHVVNIEETTEENAQIRE